MGNWTWAEIWAWLWIWAWAQVWVLTGGHVGADRQRGIAKGTHNTGSFLALSSHLSHIQFMQSTPSTSPAKGMGTQACVGMLYTLATPVWGHTWVCEVHPCVHHTGACMGS